MNTWEFCKVWENLERERRKSGGTIWKDGRGNRGKEVEVTGVSGGREGDGQN